MGGVTPIRMNFRKTSKRPLTPPPYFRKKMLRFFWEARKFATKFIRIGVTPLSQKNPCLMVALPPGKFLRVRKVFARIYEIHHKKTCPKAQISRWSGNFPDGLESFRM